MHVCSHRMTLWVGMLVAATAPPARSIVVDIDSAPMYVDTGVTATPGQSFLIIATGSVDLADGGGSYITDPDGVLLQAPPVHSPAYGFFLHETEPAQVAPAPGQRRFVTPDYRKTLALADAPYGALVAAFTARPKPMNYRTDFPAGWTMVGASGTVRVPDGPDASYRMFLSVNDIWYDQRPDNRGAFHVRIEAIPEPGSLALIGLAPLALAASAFRRRRAS